MKTKDFKNLYSSDSFLNTLIHKSEELYNLKDENQGLLLNGIKGSLLSIIVSAIFEKTSKTQIIITNDEEEASYLYTDLLNILSDQNVYFFPQRNKDKNRINFSNKSNELIRTEIISNIIYNKEIPKIVITYPEAITDKIINSDLLDQNSKVLNSGQSIYLKDLTEWLFAQKFEKVETVLEPGEFSIRGGIIDIYSYSKQEPYRIELFGNEIENIRIFDPNSQLSLDTIEKAVLINNNFKQDKLNKISFFDIFQEKSYLWIKDKEYIKSIFDKQFGENKSTSDTYKNWLKNIENLNKIWLKNSDTNLPNLNYNSESQISFNNNYDLLSKELLKHQYNNYKIIIASEHFRSGEKIQIILNEKNKEIEINLLKLGLYKGFIDHNLKIVCYTDHQIQGRFYQKKVHKKYSSKDSLSLKHLYELKIGDYIVHIDHGIGQFGGIKKIENKDKKQEVIKLIYKNNDLVYLNIHNLHKIVRYSGKEGKNPALNKLGTLAWDNKKKSIKKKVKDIAEDLINLYSKRKNTKGFAYKKDDTMQIAFESSFIFEDTPDQVLATRDTKQDMEKPYPMDRLICGDVGFGKTEIAMRAAFKAVNNNKQVAVLVPTTVLTMQHYKSFKKRFEDFPIVIDYINRFKTTKETTQTLKELNEGKIDILIGTHALVGNKVKFKDLGLLIIDEEQKFGVSTKEHIKKLKVNVDVLTLTATPIPRTLHFSLMGARDLSIISTPPLNRQPIETHILKFQIDFIIEAIKKELERNGQVFFVHNRIKNIEEIANLIRSKLHNSRVGIAHGQMEGKTLENQMVKFIEGDYDILVSTSIIESGLDIPNANTIIINDAHMFGLSDLHQMRGRVGRSNKKAYCYLISPPIDLMTSDARKRISALEEFSDIGDGFKIAMKDLDIRGAGNLLGGEQSGFIGDIGFDMYHKILDEAVEELKETKFKGLFEKKESLLKKDCLIETDFEILIPEDYVKSQPDRINLYMKIDKIKDHKELKEIKLNLKDRYGEIPEPVNKLLEIVKLRWQAQKLGIDKIKLKKGDFSLYMNKKNYKKDSNLLENVLILIQKDPSLFSLKETESELKITIKNIVTIDKALKNLQKLK